VCRDEVLIVETLTISCSKAASQSFEVAFILAPDYVLPSGHGEFEVLAWPVVTPVAILRTLAILYIEEKLMGILISRNYGCYTANRRLKKVNDSEISFVHHGD
jgi:hypothetical protein